VLETKRKIKSFTDLLAWQEGHLLALEVYQITKNFPKDELFGLVSQIRRAAVSVTSNIAEGFSRETYKDKIRFFYMTMGSLTELQNQLLLARDIGYLPVEDFKKLAEQSVKVAKITQGLIRSSKFKIQDS
jgi:four helix bundle protein